MILDDCDKLLSMCGCVVHFFDNTKFIDNSTQCIHFLGVGRWVGSKHVARCVSDLQLSMNSH